MCSRRGFAGRVRILARQGDATCGKHPLKLLYAIGYSRLMAWVVEILEVALPEIEALPADMQARFRRIVELIQTAGLDRVREPYVKHLDGKLWEMRMSGRDGIARAIYVTATGQRAVVVRAFVKKTQKTPTGELEIARKRAQEVR
jgi:phage-related protein